MKLYFSPGACCMSCHIALEETKTQFEPIYVGKKAATEVRDNYLNINPLGAVPALQLADGKILTQNIAILEYIADLHPESNLLAKIGTWERSVTMSWLSLVATDLHKSFSPLFRLSSINSTPEAQEELRKWCFENIAKYLNQIESQLQTNEFIAGNHFTIADCYLYTVFQWTKGLGFPTDKYPALNNYSEKVATRPTVKAVHAREEIYK